MKEIAKMLLIGFAVMMALPLAYRLWLVCHPQPEAPSPSLSRYLDGLIEEGTVCLLQRPLSRWREEESKSEPKIHAWLKAHEKVVLPWEWTEEARRKDPDGYRALWAHLFRELQADDESRLKAEQKKLKELGRELWIAETVHAHRTNQLARVSAAAVTNAFPMTLVCERLEKGWLWGWNVKTERREMQKREDLLASETGWIAVERHQAQAEERRMRELGVLKRTAADRVAVLQSRLAREESFLAQTSGPQEISQQTAVRELLRLIRE